MDHPGPWVVITYGDGKVNEVFGPFDKWNDASAAVNTLSGYRQIKPLKNLDPVLDTTD